MRLRALILMLGVARLALPQTNALPARETLTYNVEWRLISAGKAQVKWSANPQPNKGWELRMRMESTGLVSKLFKVEDEYGVEMNPGACLESSQLHALEGRRKRETNITVDHGKATYLERDVTNNTTVLSHEIDVPACVHEVVGGLYFLRTMNLDVGQSAQVPVTDGKKAVMARVEAQQHEDVKTPAGTFKTTRYEVFLFNGALYKRSAHLYVWLTDDRSRLPVQIRAKMQFTVGTITLLLEKHE
jgi:hypothetical protein